MTAIQSKMNKKVAVIVVLWKSRRFLHAWFEAMAKINYPRELVELVFVDNASADRSREYVESIMMQPPAGLPKITYLPQSVNLGFSGGNNAGINYAMSRGFDYVYLINYDTRVEPDFLAHAVEAAESNEKIGAVQSLLKFWPEKDLINSSGNMIHYLGFGFCGDSRIPVREKNFIGLPEIAYPSGAGVLIKTNVLRQVGLFDKKLFAYHEDLDLGWRVKLAGYVNVLAPKSVVFHEYEFSRSIKKYYFMERNRYVLFFTNYKLATQLLFMPAFLFMEIGQFIYSFKTGWWREKTRAYFWMKTPWHWPYLISKHIRVAKTRKIKDREVLKNFTGRISYQEIDNWALKLVNPIFNLYFIVARAIIFW